MKFLLFLLAAASAIEQISPDFDVLIQNGRLIDPKNDIDSELDVAIKNGTVVAIAPNIFGSAMTEIDATGLIITPGLIDLHVHVFYGNKLFFEEFGDDHVQTRVSIQPEAFAFRTGTTTLVDAGTSGWSNFEIFKRQIIDASKVRILAHINIVETGLIGEKILEQSIRLMDPVATGLMAKQFDDIVGIKVAHYTSANYIPVELGVEAGNIGDVPIIVHFPPDPLPLSILLLEKFRPGDILTHCYANLPPTETIVNLDTHRVQNFTFMARERGVFFDIGNGGSAFDFEVATTAIHEKFYPDSISTDIKNAGDIKGMDIIMSKMLALGVPLTEVIAESTWNPARQIKRFDLGHLEVGDVADVALWSLEEGTFGFTANNNQRITGTQKFVTELTIREGDIVYDLNGLSFDQFVPIFPNPKN